MIKYQFPDSRAILQYLILQENIEQRLQGQCLGQPSGDLNVQILPCGLLSEHLLKVIHKFLVFCLKTVDQPALVLHLFLQLFDLVFHCSDFVIVD